MKDEIILSIKWRLPLLHAHSIGRQLNWKSAQTISGIFVGFNAFLALNVSYFRHLFLAFQAVNK